MLSCCFIDGYVLSKFVLDRLVVGIFGIVVIIKYVFFCFFC